MCRRGHFKTRRSTIRPSVIQVVIWTEKSRQMKDMKIEENSGRLDAQKWSIYWKNETENIGVGNIHGIRTGWRTLPALFY